MLPRVVNVTDITGKRIVGPVTQITGQKIAGSVTSWQTHDGPFIVEHLAGRSTDGDLFVFFWSPQRDWQAVNVSRVTGQKVAGSITSWQTPDGSSIVEHLAGRSPEGDLFVFFWSPQHDWQAVNVSQITGRKIASRVTSWQTRDGPMLVEHLAGHSESGSLYVFWWSPGRDWQALSVSRITGQKEERVSTNRAAKMTDALSRPFKSLKRMRNTQRKAVAILWDPRRPTDPAPAAATVRDTIFGALKSVRDYYLQNSNQNFTINNAGVLGMMQTLIPPLLHHRFAVPLPYFHCDSHLRTRGGNGAQREPTRSAVSPA